MGSRVIFGATVLVLFLGVAYAQLVADSRSKKSLQSPAQAAASATKGPRLAQLAGTPEENFKLFREMLDTHYYSIFPTGQRNAGGPQFFKFIHDNLATSHELFERYNQFYCGVSGSIVSPQRKSRLDTVKIKSTDGQCIMGQYIRCCWPCSCDIMKHARAEEVEVVLPKDPTKEARSYWVLTIGDPCKRCDYLPCPELPPEVAAYDCGGGRTKNGLRVKGGKLTDDPDGRLVFALLYEAQPAKASQLVVADDLMGACQERFEATPDQLDQLGGMGDIFVKLALVNTEETFTNSTRDLCQ